MKMKLFIVVFLCALGSLSLSAQQVDELFASVPSRVLSMLDKTARLDMIDLYNNNMKATAENVYGGQSIMEEKSDDYISIRLTDVSQWQMKLFPLSHDTLIVCVHTIASPARSSTIQAYHRDWSQAKVDFPQPTFEQFLKQKEIAKQSRHTEIVELLRVMPITITLSRNQPSITYSISQSSLPLEMKEGAAAMTKSLTYTWQAGKFVSPK